MKKLIILIFLSVSVITYGQNTPDISIIPEPVKLVRNAGSFVLPQNIVIRADNNPALKEVTNFLSTRLSVPTGSRVSVNINASSPTINLQLNEKIDPAINNEGYHLVVAPSGIVIKANAPAGLYYGAQTLVQLFPNEIETNTLVKNIKWEAPSVNITDYPRFGWRGLMFDVSRHFFTKAEVKDYIDKMVRYKYNLLHLHLTDDEGWRIQIKTLPKLTEIGAWNVKKVGYFGKFSPPTPDEPRDYGGFYTHDDIRELVKYAKERFVNILPEIDVPGHSLAAVTSYPELSCTADAKNYRVRSGEQIMDWSRGAPPIALVDNALCPANENVYAFLDKVITEVAELFPFEYIHMGGDEAAHNYWEKSDVIKALMKREGLKTIEEVQGYFTKRVEGIVTSKGKKFIGWDEILEGGLTPSAAVMSWRGLEGGIKAAKEGHEVVMSPTTFAYIDYMQGDPSIEPTVYASLRLNKAYQFEPLPAGVNPKFIKGGQANLWTEQVYNMRHAQYMTWPRGWAIAESLWSPPEKRNWNNFSGRVEKHFDRYDAAEVNYAPSIYDPIINVRTGRANQLEVILSTEIEGLDIYYTFDNSFPDRFYPKYTTPLVVPKDAAMLKLITYRGKEVKGRLLTIPIVDLQKRIKK
ncbi:MAG TPA: family 20 glycosylhydrolase [Sphingobacteriaceae bacterium]|nr:family 20 glycosylhydrolase [Sphingobacteriaceae bacterium]